MARFPDSVTIRQPDDWHVHLRDGAMLKAVAIDTARQFRRALVMPNLAPPVTTADAARSYRARILAALPEGTDFEPILTAYLTDATDPAALVDGFRSGAFLAAKLYPAHATTNSASGVSDIGRIMPVLEQMQDAGMVLCLHGEVTDPEVDIFDREAVFIERVLIPLRRRLPGLRIVLEHVTTKEAASYVAESEPGIGATVTPHHLLINRNALFKGGLRPHAYCLPVAKRETHRQALLKAVSSGSERFFLGTDSAPHPRATKEADCGCAGIYCAPTALEVYATAFEAAGTLDRLDAFASRNGAKFYGLKPNEGTITLRRENWIPPMLTAEAAGGVRPFLGGETIGWRLEAAR